MKKAFLFAFIAIFLLSGCSIQGDLPNSGTWCCDELNIKLEFYEHIMYTRSWYEGDEGIIPLDVKIDFGCGMGFNFIDEEENEYDLFIGHYSYEDDVLYLSVHYVEEEAIHPNAPKIAVQEKTYVFREIVSN